MKLLSVVGARPQFVKLAPIDRATRARGIDHLIVHTGQHYDDSMSGSFFRELGIPDPTYNLSIGSGRHGEQTGRMLEAIESTLLKETPDGVMVYGDTNSTVAAALATVKLQIPLFHLEAGLRSFNRRMPEEHNRVITDHCSDLCLAPTGLALENLSSEGLASRSVMVGDVMADVCLVISRNRAYAGRPAGVEKWPGDYYLATIHRAENTDDPLVLSSIIDGLAELDKPVYLAAHPRLVAKSEKFGLELAQGAVHLIEPLSYPQMIAAVEDAACVITDSGGLQKECFLLRTPCVTVRSETEWPETIDLGWNRLVAPGRVAQNVIGFSPTPTDANPYGVGNAAEKVIDEIETYWRLLETE